MLQILLLALTQGIQLDETVITAPRSEPTVTSSAAKRIVVSGDRLRETGARNLPQALARTTGVWMQESNLGGGSPVLRGLLGARVLIVVDGVRLNDSTTRLGPNQSLAAIDPAIVERVEILRGPSSVLYGSDAIGGVILITTRRRLPSARDPYEPLKMWEGAVLATYDSSLSNPYLSLGLSAASEEHGILGQVSGFDYYDLKSGDNQTIDNTAYNNHAVFGAYEYAMGRGQALSVTARASRDFDVPRTDRMNVGFGQTEPANQDFRYSSQDRRGYQLTYTDKRPGEIADSLQLRLFLNSYDEERDITSGDGTTSTFSRDQTVTFGLGMDWQASVGKDQLVTWGVDLAHDNVDTFRQQTDAGGTQEVAGNYAPDASYGRAGVFVQDELFGLDPWFFTIGLRFSAYDYSFGEFGTNANTSGQFGALTASFEVARELDDDTTLTGSLAQGFHAPNLDDLANQGVFAGGVELANPDLDAEQSINVDLGLAHEREQWGGAFGVFATRIDDAFGRLLLDGGDPNVSGDETYMRANTGTLELVGAELAFHHQLGEDTPYSFDGSMAYVRGRQKDPSFGGGSVPARRVPPLQGSLAVDYQPQESLFYYIPNARVQVLWAEGQNRLHPEDISDPRIDPNGTAGWVTYNLEIWGDLNYDATWRLGLLNLSDETYRVHGSGFNAAGRRAVISVRVQF